MDGRENKEGSFRRVVHALTVILSTHILFCLLCGVQLLYCKCEVFTRLGMGACFVYCMQIPRDYYSLESPILSINRANFEVPKCTFFF